MERIDDLQSGTRLDFMDRLRLILVVIVVLMHSAAAYTNIISWWSVQETPKSKGLDIFALFVDGFQMPLFFFIAGYFAYRSLNSRTRTEFIISKFRRIGFPFIAVALFLTPYITYMGIERTMPGSVSFFHSWLIQIKSLLYFKPVFFTSMEIAKKHWMDYSLWHLWFVMVLLFFYFLYAIIDYIKEKSVSSNTFFQKKKDSAMIKAFFISLILMLVSYALVNRFINDWLWGKIWFFTFQPTRMPVYVVVFFFGLYAGSNNWFTSKKIPGRSWLWGLSFLFFSVVLIACMIHVFFTWGQPYSFWFSLVHGLIRSALVITAIAFLSGIMINLSGNFTLIDTMSPYSYEIYIIHLPLVIFFAKLFTFMAMHLVLKFVCVSVLVILVSYALGRSLIKPYPRISCGVMVGVFIVLCLVYR